MQTIDTLDFFRSIQSSIIITVVFNRLKYVKVASNAIPGHKKVVLERKKKCHPGLSHLSSHVLVPWGIWLVVAANPSEKYTLWLCQNSYWKWAIYNGFSHWKWWFSIAMLVHQRVSESQLGWWHSQLNGKIIQMFQITSQAFWPLTMVNVNRRIKVYSAF